MHAIRPAAVADLFYPADAAELRASVDRFLADALPQQGPAPRAIIAPHAGFIYSGPIAAQAYAAAAPWRGVARRVIVAGPAHRLHVPGIAIPSVAAFSTPLGTIALDAAGMRALQQLPWVEVSDRAHALEHCIEVQLPFLQCLLEDFQLVPMLVGDATPAQVAQALEAVWDEAGTVLVVSSDLSHYMPWAAARERDAATAGTILRLDSTLLPEDACGAAPINGLLRIARARGLDARLLDVRNSGDTAGDRDRVVGYGAFQFVEAAHG
ncbi:MAG TPA: AmmeMemoRadiSam system protein B [Usitatibacter sp.]|nr:AmmeMemoRadiSam system protein B [Usitatibacter sp.]